MRAEVLRRFGAGESAGAIAAALGLDRTTVRHHLVAGGAYTPRKNRPAFSFGPDHEAQMRADYPAAGATAMAARFGCTARQVTCKAYQMGLRSLNRGRLSGQTRAAANDTVDLAFFDRWTPESAYVLGYLWADGCVRTEDGKPAGLEFLCTEEDVQLLRDVAAAMGHTPNIRRTDGRDWVQQHGNYAGRKYRSKPAVRFSIGSTLLAQKLIRDHGLAPRKSSLDLPFPGNVPDEFLSHFARGNLDGDGSVVVRETTRRATVSWLGTPAFLTGLVRHISRLTEVTPACVSMHGRNVLKGAWTAKSDVLRLRDWLYRDATICLGRKRTKFDETAAVLATVRGYSRRRRAGHTVVFRPPE